MVISGISRFGIGLWRSVTFWASRSTFRTTPLANEAVASGEVDAAAFLAWLASAPIGRHHLFERDGGGRIGLGRVSVRLDRANGKHQHRGCQEWLCFHLRVLNDRDEQAF
jgi:hypothetical protein